MYEKSHIYKSYKTGFNHIYGLPKKSQLKVKVVFKPIFSAILYCLSS